MKGNKGITLIALIITIIIMLILAGVTINIAVNGGLFTQAQKAADLTNGAAQNEQATINDAIDKISNYANGGGTNNYAGVNIGDYVNYEVYLTTKTYTALASDTGCTIDGEGTCAGLTDQTFKTDTNVKWRVLDNSNGTLTLVSDEPVNWDNGTNSNGLYLQGAIGYNNAETVLNNMCNILYTTTKGTARSMTFADAAKVTGWDKVPHDDAWVSASGWWGETLEEYEQKYTYTNAYDPTVNNGTTPVPTLIETNTYDGFSLYDENIVSHMTSQPSTIVLDIVYGPTRWNWSYWFASKAIHADSYGAQFYVGGIIRE